MPKVSIAQGNLNSRAKCTMVHAVECQGVSVTCAVGWQRMKDSAHIWRMAENYDATNANESSNAPTRSWDSSVACWSVVSIF